MRYLILFLIPSLSWGWYCEKVASEWLDPGLKLSVCGVGQGLDEAEARDKAFDNAKIEFSKVCSEDTTCGKRAVNIAPQRSDCRVKGPTHVCHRLFHFFITDERRENVFSPSNIPKEIPATVVHKNILQREIHNHNQITIVNHPKEVIPMSKNKNEKYAHFVRSVGSVSIYETNHRGHQGVYLTNPSEKDLEIAIKRASKSGALNRIYILRN